MRKSDVLLGKQIPFVESAFYGMKQRPSAILLRTSWTTDRSGAANGIAQTWHNPRNKFTSSHYVVDESTVLRCVPDKLQSGDTMTTFKGAIGINVCHDPPDRPQPTTVSLAAQLTSRLCALYHIPPRLMKVEDQEKWGEQRVRRRRHGGIILKTVGPFPEQEFFALVQKYMKAFDRKD